MIRPSFIKGLNNEIMTIKDHIVEFLLYNNFSCFIRRTGRFIKRLLRWFPVLWNQEDWDYEYIYDLIEMKMKELYLGMSKDYWHDQKGVQKRLKQIKICLAYLDRYRNWPNYYDYPTDDIQYVSSETCKGCYQVIHTSSINEVKRKGARTYEKFMYDMFWKRFLQWHQGWWT